MELPPLDYAPTIPSSIRRAAARFGDRDFVVMPDRRLSYTEAEAASRRVAKELLAAGVGKGTRVAMIDTFSLEWTIFWLAATRIGALFVPMASTMKPPELRWALRHSDIHLMVVPPSLLGVDLLDFVERAVPGLAEAGAAPQFLPELPYLRDVRVTTPTARTWAGHLDCSIEGDAFDTGLVDDVLLERAEAEVVPADPMVIVHTSGSTSEPKGVVHTHGALIRHGANLARNFQTGLDPDDRCFAGLPFFWVGGLSFILLRSLHRGSAVLCMARFDADGAIDLLEREHANRFLGYDTMMDAITSHPSSASHDLSAIADFNGAIPRSGSPLHHNSLGMTETCGPHTACPAGEFGQELPEELHGSFGRTVPHVQHKIVDPESGAPVADGVDGEICVRGYNVMDGMYKRERHDVFDDDGWYHTNDRGSWHHGCLFFKGRLSEMIKTAGANVSPREVEVALEQLPGVELAQVVGLPDEKRGELVAAVLVSTPDGALDIDEIVERLREAIASYKVPGRFAVTTHDDIPLLASTKIDRRELARRLTTGELPTTAPG
jgi:acyl-CoA synthetase (AMP-forming)/AMP-acid ligase II